MNLPQFKTPHSISVERDASVVVEAPRRTAVVADYDVLVVGGGPAGVMAALSVWAVFTLMRLQSWKILGASIVLSMLVATLLMFGAQATIPLRSPGMIGYWTLGAWFTSVCAASAQIVMPMAVGVAVGHAKSKKAGTAS